MNTSITVSVSVLSGKGGVGKSNLALNLCYGLHQLGHTVLLMDCDMGLANMDVLLGIAPEHHIQDILTQDRDPRDILVPIGPPGTEGFDLLPANSGMAEFADLDGGARAIIRERVNPFAERYNFLVLDIGAGISPTALGFGAMTALRLLVITSEPTSLTDSYALMKVLSARYNEQAFHIVVNQVDTPAEAKQTFSRLSVVCQRFLGFTPSYLGYVRSDKSLVEAVRKQKPLMQIAPRSPASVDFMALAKTLHDARGDMLTRGLVAEPLRDVDDTF